MNLHYLSFKWNHVFGRFSVASCCLWDSQLHPHAVTAPLEALQTLTCVVLSPLIWKLSLLPRILSDIDPASWSPLPSDRLHSDSAADPLGPTHCWRRQLEGILLLINCRGCWRGSGYYIVLLLLKVNYPSCFTGSRWGVCRLLTVNWFQQTEELFSC